MTSLSIGVIISIVFSIFKGIIAGLITKRSTIMKIIGIVFTLIVIGSNWIMVIFIAASISMDSSNSSNWTFIYIANYFTDLLIS